MLLTTKKWVTQSQSHKTEPSMNHIWIIYYSHFLPSLLNSSGLILKIRSKVMQREKRKRREDFRTVFKWRVLRKAFLRDGEKIAQAWFVVSEAVVKEFHFLSHDLIIMSSPRHGNGKAHDVNKHELPQSMFLFTLKAMTVMWRWSYSVINKPELLIWQDVKGQTEV